MIYRAETLTLRKKSINRLRRAQRSMERSMMGVFLRDKISNEEIRRRTRVINVVQKIASLKWNLTGHIARMSDGR